MGNILVLKGADFSENAVPVSNVYDLVKQTDVNEASASPGWPMTNQGYYYNNVAIANKITVYAVSFVIPGSADSIDLTLSSDIIIAAVNGTDVLREVSIDVSDIMTKFKNGQIAGGSIQTVALTTPFVFNAGEYLAARGGKDSASNRCLVYSRTPSGNFGYMATLGGAASTYNLAVNLYGE